MLDLYIAANESEIRAKKLRPRISLGGPVYWHLHRYFIHADLAPGSYSFLNLNEDTEISGYQLHRLKTELNEALTDLTAKNDVFSVFVGWQGTMRSRDSEDWRSVQKSEVRQTILDLLNLIAEARENDLALFAIGD
jgi:hypothetical protein